MKIGYARVSTEVQHTANQIELLEKDGCERIYQDTASGGCWDRPELHKALDNLRKGDVLVVWKFDRLSRSLGDLIRIIQKIDESEASFRSLTESIDTSNAVGRAMMHMLGTFAEFEREMIRERTMVGLKRARAKGRVGGGRYLLTKAQEAHAIEQLKAGKSQTEVAEDQRVSKATMSRLVGRARAKGLLV